LLNKVDYKITASKKNFRHEFQYIFLFEEKFLFLKELRFSNFNAKLDKKIQTFCIDLIAMRQTNDYAQGALSLCQLQFSSELFL